MSSPTTAQRLCIFCRQLEDISSECPTLKRLRSPTEAGHLTLLQPDPVSPLPQSDELLLSDLQKTYPSHGYDDLCSRCKNYDITRVFRDAEPLDAWQQSQRFGNDNAPREAYQRELAAYELHPRPALSDLVLIPSCPLCRLIYRIMPRENLDPRDNMIKLTPYRSHLRLPAWQTLTEEKKSSNAILLGVQFPEFAVPTVGPLSAASDGQWGYIGPESMTGEAIALSPACTFPGRKENNFRFITPLVDYKLVRAALDRCNELCGPNLCYRTHQPPELLTATMIDVIERVTVPCPPNCDYFALSYVWGNVMPAPNALESKTLPQTIEDAITVTKELGKRYLWVDALCIDQTPTQLCSPEQLQRKFQQLSMMDLIYGCASLTLVAMAGSDSNAGLVGVTKPRTSQLKETIHDKEGHKYEFYTIPPGPLAEKDASVWDSRAWTFQESLLSRRKLCFTGTQMYFQCQRLGIMECFDFEPDTLNVEMQINPALQDDVGRDGLVRLRGGVETDNAERKKWGDKVKEPDWFLHGFLGLIEIYTSRKMTHASDSLNALLGILSAWEKNLLPKGHTFSWGLPLATAPQFLGWMHDRSVGKAPKRRADFPSWSWCGWEGEVVMEDHLPVGLYSSEKLSRVGDLTVNMVSLDGKMLVVEGWVVKLHVRTEPFSEVVVADGTANIGSIKERNFLHNNTLPTGEYECLVIERVRVKRLSMNTGRESVKVFLLVLDPCAGSESQTAPAETASGEGSDGLLRERRTMITLTMFAGGEFESTRPVKKVVKLV
ncbi:HET domain containing protein [Naviculisporaceae sp. PSN 640]